MFAPEAPHPSLSPHKVSYCLKHGSGYWFELRLFWQGRSPARKLRGSSLPRSLRYARDAVEWRDQIVEDQRVGAVVTERLF
jgi:hypothetical protein